MKWFKLTAPLLLIAVSSTAAQAELFGRMNSALANYGYSASPAYVTTLGDEGTYEVGTEYEGVVDEGAVHGEPEYISTHGAYGHHHGAWNYNHFPGNYPFGCCEQDPSYAMSLWAGYCGHRHRCRAPRCRPVRCRPMRCCKPRCCRGFHGLHRCGGRRACCGPKLFGNWFSHHAGCDDCTSGCGVSDCGCGHGHGCNCGQGGEILHDGAEGEIFDNPPMPEPAPKGKPAKEKSARKGFLLPIRFEL